MLGFEFGKIHHIYRIYSSVCMNYEGIRFEADEMKMIEWSMEESNDRYILETYAHENKWYPLKVFHAGNLLYCTLCETLLVEPGTLRYPMNGTICPYFEYTVDELFYVMFRSRERIKMMLEFPNSRPIY